jgi:hypothetical protein
MLIFVEPAVEFCLKAFLGAGRLCASYNILEEENFRKSDPFSRGRVPLTVGLQTKKKIL